MIKKLKKIKLNDGKLSTESALKIVKTIDKLIDAVNALTTNKPKQALEKSWPNSWKEAQEISEFWGLWADLSNGLRRHMIALNNHVGIISVDGVFCTDDEINDYFANDGYYNGIHYSIIYFDSARELYLWMAEDDAI